MEPVAERRRAGRVTALLRLGVAVVLFLTALLTVFPAPSYNLWKLSVLVTERGHFLALAALLLMVLPGWWRTKTGSIAAVIAVVAAALFISPLVRARPVASALETVLTGMQPRSAPGAAPLRSPLSVAGLLTKPATPDVRQTTLKYAGGNGRTLEVDLYRRSGTRRAEPLVVVIHGGSWMGGAKSDLAELNSYLAARGYVIAAPSYRFAPEFRHPSQSEDISAAMGFLKVNAAAFGIDTTRIAFVGRSAGGQLALMAAYAKEDPSIRGVVAFYAPTDQRWGWENPSDPRVYDSFATLNSFLGGGPRDDPEAYRTSSPIEFIGYATVPTLLIHGSRDELVSVRQSARLDSALSVSRRPHLFIEMPWATHGCDYVFNGPCGQISTYAIERFLASVM